MRSCLFLGLALSLVGVGVSAQPPAAPPPAALPTATGADPGLEQSLIAARYRQLEDLLLRIAQKLERSGSPENGKKARIIQKALKEARDKAIAVNLTQLAEALKKPSLAELKKAVDQGSAVKVDLEQLLLALLADDENNKDKMKQLADLIKELDSAIRTQKVANAKNKAPSVDANDAAQAQEIAKLQTEKILQKLKEQQGKPGEGDNKDAKGDPKEGQGEPKDGKGKEGKEAKPGDKKEQKPGDKQDGKADGKEGKPKDEKEGKEGKPQDGKEGKEAKPGDQKEGKPKDGKEGKEGEPQEGKDSKESKEGKEGKPSQQQQPGQQGQEGQEGQQQEQKPVEEQEGAIPRQKIQDANDLQKKAGDQIKKDKRDQATNDQEEATKKLEEARKRLEEILRQMREEEIERVLADLQRRCEQMLQMQEIVFDNTKRLFGKIQSLPEHKATREEEIASRRLAESEDKILELADKTILVIEAEGSAVAFLETFRQVRGDVGHISRRLGRVDAGPETQIIEEDVIATLKDMIEALKKQQKEQREKKNQQQQQQQNGQPPPQALLDKLAELRMIKALQVRVNARTKLWAQRYQGEQAGAMEIVAELRDLGQRQLKIYEVTDNVAKGRNK